MALISTTYQRGKFFKFSRQLRNKIHSKWMFLSLMLIVITPFILGIGLFVKSNLLFQDNSLNELLFSTEWIPTKGKFGFLPFIVSSLWVTFIALLISAPICLFSAILLTQYGKKWFLKLMLPVIDILAGIPSVIYGVWGILIIVPLVSDYIAPLFGAQTSGFNIFSGAVVLSIMIMPFMLNILIEIFKSIPKELTEVSLSLGASRWETIKRVLVKKASPGIIAAFGLGLSRAFGETIAVLMVVGNVITMPTGIFQPGYPLPALIANNYGEMMSIPMYDSALMLAALILFVVVILFNLISRIAITRLDKIV